MKKRKKEKVREEAEGEEGRGRRKAFGFVLQPGEAGGRRDPNEAVLG